MNVACPARKQCTALDRFGTEITFNPRTGRRLTIQQVDSDRLTSLSCPSRTLCSATDSAGRTVEGDPVRRILWTITSLPGADALLAVFCRTQHQCIVTDADGRVFIGQV